MVKIKKVQKVGFAIISALVIPIILFKLINGNLDIFWNLAFGFYSLSFATAHEAHLFPVDEDAARITPMSNSQRNFTYLAVLAGLVACSVWYVTGLVEYL